ncbi:MAG: tRNA-dihydrouridine synthase, partial [Bdellovibrionota bacterium]
MLAPMEGVVDAMMRDRLTRIGGIDLCVTEFLRVQDRLLPDSEFRKDAPELFTGAKTPAGIPVLVQFLGGQATPIAANAVRAVELGALGIDLNFGCPAKTVNRHDGGATLLKNPTRLFDVVSAVRAAIPEQVPVSAKVRLGFSDKEFHLDIARAADEGGVSWLTVHARTRDEGYRPPAHWEFIARMREAVSMTVIANGEIWTREDYAKAREISGCRHVMIGRGLLSDPGLAREIKGLSASASWPEALNWFELYVRESLEWKGEDFAAARAKQWMRSLGRRYDIAKTTFEETKRL